jgi:HSP20 family molecular chaperone IbpA
VLQSSIRPLVNWRSRVPLPEGAKEDTATATFENGVLKVEIETPAPEQSRGRRIEVRE